MFGPSFHFSSLIWVRVMMNAGWGGKKPWCPLLLLGDPEATPDQQGYIIPPMCSGSRPSWTCLGVRPQGGNQGDQMIQISGSFQHERAEGWRLRTVPLKAKSRQSLFLAAKVFLVTFCLYSKLPQGAQLYKGSFILLYKVSKRPLHPWLFLLSCWFHNVFYITS